MTAAIDRRITNGLFKITIQSIRKCYVSYIYTQLDRGKATRILGLVDTTGERDGFESLAYQALQVCGFIGEGASYQMVYDTLVRYKEALLSDLQDKGRCVARDLFRIVYQNGKYYVKASKSIRGELGDGVRYKEALLSDLQDKGRCVARDLFRIVYQNGKYYVKASKSIRGELGDGYRMKVSHGYLSSLEDARLLITPDLPTIPTEDAADDFFAQLGEEDTEGMKHTRSLGKETPSKANVRPTPTSKPRHSAGIRKIDLSGVDVSGVAQTVRA